MLDFESSMYPNSLSITVSVLFNPSIGFSIAYFGGWPNVGFSDLSKTPFINVWNSLS